MDASLQVRAPSVQEYLNLTEAVGWADYVSADAAAVALANSHYCVVAVLDERVVGMGRIVGDAALFFYIQDVLVVPDVQGRGVGRLIMDGLMSWIEEHAPPNAFVGLFSAEGKAPFYEQYGFASRSKGRPGMELVGT